MRVLSLHTPNHDSDATRAKYRWDCAASHLRASDARRLKPRRNPALLKARSVRSSRADKLPHLRRRHLGLSETWRGFHLVRRRCEVTQCAASSEDASRKESIEDVWNAFRGVKWDAPPRSWDSFWAVKTAGTFVETDLDAGTVTALPIKSLDLSIPLRRRDWLDRLRTNIVFYRQNYLAAILVVLLLSALPISPPAALGLAAACAAAVCRSNTLLGELSLWLTAKVGEGHPLVFNDLRVAGVDRGQAYSVLSVLAVLGVSAGMTRVAGSWIAALIFVAWFIMAHASVRPVNLKSIGGSLIEDLKGAKSSKEVTKKVGKAFGKLGRMVNNKLDEVKEGGSSTPFTVWSVKGSGMPQEPGGGRKDDGPPPPPPSPQRKLPQ
ncbi:hypothetical protein CYMTET_50763 [Cymbomonas tetramitiformis]|uniref:PRA1 family protein n=1 Tax=Cymbomonas tetramitiformis TaxID=36881 RepID=A0AAE0BNL7_9CHLO|nr:hypothetical protein CYMTET_50763 [Cymbomonas tetramitiformis]